MNKVSDGGPAFPEGLHAADVEMAGGRYDGAYVSRYEQIDSGMSLRDYFAAKAMQAALALCANDAREEGLSYFEHVSGVSYAMADAMLKARRQ